MYRNLILLVAFIQSFNELNGIAIADDAAKKVKETAQVAPNDVEIKVRMEGPYTADVPLQIVCYFRYSPDGEKKLTGAPLELDKRLGGVIASLRKRGEFIGDEMETLLLTPPEGSIPARKLLLIGLGDESSLSLEKMERVGKVAFREASRLGVSKVAFAPLIKDAGNDALPAGDTETAVIRGMLSAYDIDLRLQKENFAVPFTLQEWWVEAGPKYYDETVAGVKKGAAEAATIIKSRTNESYSKLSR